MAFNYKQNIFSSFNTGTLFFYLQQKKIYIKQNMQIFFNTKYVDLMYAPGGTLDNTNSHGHPR